MFDNDDNTDEKDLTINRDDVIDMLVKRQKMWLEASVVIANLLPDAWDVIEGYLAETHNVTNLLLSDLTFEPSTELLKYSVFEQGDTLVYHVPIPLSLAVNPGDEGEKLLTYLNSLPPPPSQQTDGEPITPESKIRKQLHHTLDLHPGMYMDVDRLTELEIQSTKGQFIKYPVAEKLQ